MKILVVSQDLVLEAESQLCVVFHKHSKKSKVSSRHHLLKHGFVKQLIVMKSNRGARNLLEKMIDLYDLLQKYCFGCIDIFQFALIPTIVPAGFSHNASQSFVGIRGDIT